LPRIFKDACGIKSKNAAQEPSQHLANNFQEFGERRLVDTHGGRESRNEFWGSEGAWLSVFCSACPTLPREEVCDGTFSDVLVSAVRGGSDMAHT